MPFTLFLGDNYHANEKFQLLYLFKLFRLQKMAKLLKPRIFKTVVKDYYRAKMQRKMKALRENNISIAFATKEDHNYIMRQIILLYAFRVTRLVIVLFSVSYFTGTLWYIFIWLSDDGVSEDTNFFGFYQFRQWKANNEDTKA